MVFNATFNDISVISWQSVLLVEETRVPKEKQLHFVYEIIYVCLIHFYLVVMYKLTL